MKGSRAAVAAAVSGAAAVPRKGGSARVGPWRRPCGPSASLSFLPGDLPLIHPSVLKEAAAAAAGHSSSSPRPAAGVTAAAGTSSSSSTSTRAAAAAADGWWWHSSSDPQSPTEEGERERQEEKLRKKGEADEAAFAARGIRSTAAAAKAEFSSSASAAEYPFFKPREHFNFDRSITWYPPHMHKSTLAIDKCYKYVDCVIEVRDARAPFSSSNPFLLSAIRKTCLRLVLLNKADLLSKKEALRAQAAVEELGTPCLLTCAPMLKHISNITSFVLKHCSTKHQQQQQHQQQPQKKKQQQEHQQQQQEQHQQQQEQQQQEQQQQEQQQQQRSSGRRFKSIGYWMMLVGLPNTGKSSVLNAMKKVALQASYYGRPNNKIVEGVKRTRAKEGRHPGVTREVSAYQISNQPRLYCYDTPGIMLPKMKNPETNLKLAALGCVDDHQAGEMYVADYILFLLNRMRCFEYVRVLDLPEPSNDIQEVAHHVYEAAYALKVRCRRCPPPPDLLSGCRLFLQLFRSGFFGRCSLDFLPLPACMRPPSHSDAPAAAPLTLEEALREPPSPWGI